jgi:uncharacterized hydrophobic protein (TIGR00271 family)
MIKKIIRLSKPPKRKPKYVEIAEPNNINPLQNRASQASKNQKFSEYQYPIKDGNWYNIFLKIKNHTINFHNRLPAFKVLFRAHRMWRNQKFVATINHLEVIKDFFPEGKMSSRYSFMVINSCAIAILGLLLSSPAVVIGAMLLSPLISPIMALGFSLCTVDIWQMKKSLRAIIFGMIASIVISMIIVAISPITDPTPEIISRTQPNLFDLLVAIFSGLAGGYATVKKKGESIVGVAIATALMPPLAVVGYGVATFNWVIAEGAFFLFMTNLLAICFTVVAVAKWYGFGSHNSSKSNIWQMASIFIVFLFLSIPLGISLKNIAYQSYVTKVVKSEIGKYFEFANNRLSNFSITFKANKNIAIDCVLITDRFVPKADQILQKKLEEILNRKVVLSFDQVVIAKREQESIVNTALLNQIQSTLEVSKKKEDISKSIKDAATFPIEFIKIDQENSKIFIHPQISANVDLSALHNEEKQIRSQFLEWTIFVIPSFKLLPIINFKVGDYKLSEAENVRMEDAIWLLKRLNTNGVSLYGYNNKNGESRKISNYNLTKKRLKIVSNILKDEGINVDKTLIYNSSNQNDQRKSGYIEIKNYQ